MEKVFVYGTLKKGGRLNGHLDNSKFIEEKTLTGFKMYNVGWFPGIIVTNNNEDVIHGEVYEVSPDTLNRLDMVEGVPHLYKRHNDNDLS